MSRLRRTELDERVAEIASWRDSLVPPKRIAQEQRRDEHLGEWARHELEALVRMSDSDAKERLDRLGHERDDDWLAALEFAADEAQWIPAHETEPAVGDGLAAEIKRRKEHWDEQKELAWQQRLKDSRRRFFEQFEGKTDPELRAAVEAYVHGAEKRDRLWRGTETTLRDRLGVAPLVGRPTGRKIDPDLLGAVDLIDQIEAHLRAVDEGTEQERMLSESAEYQIRSALAEYVSAVTANRKRDIRKVWLPIVALTMGLIFGGIVVDPEDYRESGLFNSLAEILPVILLALTVEVGFLANRGVPRALSVFTVLVVSIGFGACLYVLITDNPGRLAAGVSIGAALAGLTGLVAAVLSRQAGPRELPLDGNSIPRE